MPGRGRRRWRRRRRRLPRPGAASIRESGGATPPGRRASRRLRQCERAVGVLAGAADEMDGGGERAWPCAETRVSISVSIGQEPVMIQPASTTAFKIASQLAVVLLAKTMVPIPSGRRTRRPSAKLWSARVRKTRCLASSCSVHAVDQRRFLHPLERTAALKSSGCTSARLRRSQT